MASASVNDPRVQKSITEMSLEAEISQFPE
jgi:hypothetical protein